MGKHSAEGTPAGGSGRLVLLLLLGVVAVALVGVGLSAVLGDDDTGTSPQARADAGGPGDTAAPTPTAPAGGATSTDSPGPSSSSTAVPPADAAPTTSPPGDAAPADSAALLDCAERTRAGDDWAAAVAGAASNWETHYQASIGLNSGELSLPEAEADWDRTREAGPADLEEVDVTSTAFDTTADGCDALAGAERPAGLERQAQDCLARASALDDLRVPAERVLTDWAHHQEMMATKDEVDPEEYIVMWREDVAFAPTRMQPYRDAAAALAQAPACDAA